MKQKPKNKAPEKKLKIKRPRAISITLRLEPDTVAELDALAEDSRLKRSGVIQLAVSRILKTGI